MQPSVPVSQTALRAYRELLKVQRALFKGDAQGRVAAHLETRDQFLRHANASPSETPDLIQDAYNTAGFLHENVAQTVLNEAGNYGACYLSPLTPNSSPDSLCGRCAELKPQPQHLSDSAIPPPLPCGTSVNL